MAHQHQPGGCAIPQDLRYYMLQGNDVMVPMVPADQLPFRLPGVPRQLTHRQMSVEGWRYLSEPTSAPSAPPVQAPSIPLSSHPATWAKSQFRAPDHQVRNDQYVMDEQVARPSRWSHSPTVPIDISSTHRKTPTDTPEKSLSLTDKLAELYPHEAQRCGYQMRNPSGIEQDSSKKEYCTHWLRTGECDFTAIGCKYTHEMPEIVKLRELGFAQGLPRWWKEKLATPARGPTWIEQRRAAQGNDEDLKPAEMPARREFDPSVFKRRSESEQSTPNDKPRPRRSLLRREIGCERSVQSVPSHPSTPVRHGIQPASSVADLLIDLYDTPSPLPSPQLYTPSSASTVSGGTAASDLISDPPSAMKAVPISFTCSISTHKHIKSNLEERAPAREPLVRRDSDMSWNSAISNEPKHSLPATPEPPKRTHEQKPAMPQNSKQVAETNRPSLGLGSSRHAPSGSQTTHDDNGTGTKEAQVSQQQQQQKYQYDKTGSPLEVSNKVRKLRHRARNHSAPVRDRVSGAVAKASGGAGRKTAV